MLQTLGNAAAIPIPIGRPMGEQDMFPATRDETSGLPRFGMQACQLDRRSSVRLPIEQDVRYKVRTRSAVTVGFGKTVDMSSTGVLFTTEKELALGEKLEVAINWPALLDHKCPLKLVTMGRVVRTGGGLAAVAIERYEFRTQGIHGMV